VYHELKGTSGALFPKGGKFFIRPPLPADDQLLAGIDKIRHLPCRIVQGRYDMICPAVTADDLAVPA
jgi:hypothetical protein